MVIDLCSGDRSLQPIVEKHGMTYVAVDQVHGTAAVTAKARRAALCVIWEGEVLMVARAQPGL